MLTPSSKANLPQDNISQLLLLSYNSIEALSLSGGLQDVPAKMDQLANPDLVRITAFAISPQTG